MTYPILTDAPITEDPRTQLRRRLQQRRCLVCGVRQLAGNAHSYFCAAHLITHRFCPMCEGLRTAAEHGKDTRCLECNRRRGLAGYYADRDRTLYRLRLKQIARRQTTRVDQIFVQMRKRIALAEFVRATPGWSWPMRARHYGVWSSTLATAYREQCAGRVLDVDASERSRKGKS